MGSKKKNPFLVQISCFLLFMISATYAALEDQRKAASAKMIIEDFCNQRITREDRLFCALVFQPNSPQTRTNTIKDNLGLLRVAVQFSLGNAMKTYKDFLNKETSIVAVLLEQCLSAYSDYIKELKIILGDLEDDPPMVNYDSRMAGLALSRCHNYLADSNKIHDDSILGRDKVAQQYSKLIQEISKIV